MECVGALVYYIDPENEECKVLGISAASPSAVGPRAAHGRPRPRRRPGEPGVAPPGAGWFPRRGAASVAVLAHCFCAAQVVAAPEAWTRRKGRSSTTRTLRLSSTPPSSTGTVASSGFAPGTAVNSLSVQDHAGGPASHQGTASAGHAVGAGVSKTSTQGKPRGPPTVVSCSSAAGRRIGILPCPARSSQSSRILGPAASPPILLRGSGQPHFAARAG